MVKREVTEAPALRKGAKCRAQTGAVLLLGLLSLSGCMRSVATPSEVLTVDPMTTSSITPLSADSELLSDEAAVAAAVGAADAQGPLPWSNSATGSSGVITGYSDSREGTRDCRAFRTSRHGFDGIALFEGVACRRPAGQGWRMERFERSAG